MDSFRTRVHWDAFPIEDFPGATVVLDTQVQEAADIHGVAIPDSRPVLPLQADEQHKDWSSVEYILGALLEKGAARDDLLVGIGGGVLCDVAAFSASIYMRGIDCVLVPTTLLSMVDAAFGGKTGMNFGGYKNMVGSFYPARDLYIQPDFLRSLPATELQSGMGEVFKAALLEENDLWPLLQKSGSDLMLTDRRSDESWQRLRPLWREVIEMSLMVKGRIVAADFRENGQRAFLNLGHTYGHAAEAVLGFGTLPHGTLVVWGIIRALRLGELLGITPASYRKEVQELAEQMGFPVTITLPRGTSVDQLVHAMRSDKKKRGGRVRFVLQQGRGRTEQRVVEESLVHESLVGGVLTAD